MNFEANKQAQPLAHFRTMPSDELIVNICKKNCAIEVRNKKK